MVSPYSSKHDIIHTRLIFVRHGQIDSNTLGRFSIWNDEPLNADGIDQIEKASKRIFSQFEPDVILCSPIFRAKMSAEIIAGDRLQPIEVADLAEVHFGEVSGLTMSEIAVQFPHSYQAFTEYVQAEDQSQMTRPVIPGGETTDDIIARVRRFTELVLQSYPGKLVVAVSHGAFIKCALQVYAGADFTRSVPFWIDNGSITVVDFFKNKPMIRLVNDAHHINDLIPVSPPGVL